jgi:alkanesulfonate monooxygenase SsuD/methylene tetrahydromethanopterin reductase-like flavin-dependent oxidoreductase (luciferase family)
VDIGIGLPTTVPGTRPDVLVDWARQADQGPFASLGVLDRIVYDAYEPLMSLAAAAAVTERIQLVTSILIAPLRETATLAKQIISLDALSGGRVTLGVAIGARGDDYDVDEFGKGGRGDRLSEQLIRIRDLWEDAAITPSAATREAPRILVGGMSGPAFGRAARHADGWIFSGGPSRAFAKQAEQATAAWTEHGRPGAPQRWAMGYFALDGAAEAGRDYLLDYYAFTGPFAQRIADGLLATPLQVREHVQGLKDAGCDHLVLFPCVSDPGQIDLLADVVG